MELFLEERERERSEKGSGKSDTQMIVSVRVVCECGSQGGCMDGQARKWVEPNNQVHGERERGQLQERQNGHNACMNVCGGVHLCGGEIKRERKFVCVSERDIKRKRHQCELKNDHAGQIKWSKRIRPYVSTHKKHSSSRKKRSYLNNWKYTTPSCNTGHATGDITQ